MAKAKQQNAVDPAALAQDQQVEAESQTEIERTEILVALPIGVCFAGFATPDINCKLTARQAAAAKMLWSSASEAGLRYQGGIGSHPRGSAVESAAGGIRFMLDRYADAFEEASGKSLTSDFCLQFR